MIYAINNGCEHEDEAIYFIETDLMPSELAALIEIEHGPADQQNHRWTKITGPGIGIGFPERDHPKAHVREIPYLLFIADVSTWAPDLENGGYHGGISAARLTKTPRGEIYWLARESTGRLEQLAKVERARAIEDLAAKATGHPRANGHPKWQPFEPIRAELEWRQLGKTCGCGRHHTARAWLELEHARFQYTSEDDEGSAELLECRHCSCGSTIARLHRLPFKWRPHVPLELEKRDTARRLEALVTVHSGAYASARRLPDAPNCYLLHLSARPFGEGQDLYDVEPVGAAVLAEVVRRLRDAPWTNTLAGLRVLNGRADVVLWWPAAVRYAHPGSTSWIDAAQEAIADQVEAAAEAAPTFEESLRHRARIDRLRGSAAFSIDGISTAMRERGVVIATTGEGDQTAGVASFRLATGRTGEPLTPEAWRDVIAWFVASTPVAIRVVLSDGHYVWDSASSEGPVAIPLRPRRPPV